MCDPELSQIRSRLGPVGHYPNWPVANLELQLPNSPPHIERLVACATLRIHVHIFILTEDAGRNYLAPTKLSPKKVRLLLA